MRPVPVGVDGELYIGGVGVARGYLNRPELTAERFVTDPFSDAPGARLYRTGDMARWRADGNLEYRGRNDHQVKIRGYRIELGEIESRLMRHEAVREAVVLAREDEPGQKRLVAYYTSDAESAPSVESLRAHLQSQLPSYMVPAAYVWLEKWPLSPNGKLDRKALPSPEGDAYGQRSYEAPEGEIETALAGIWQPLLKIDRVGRHDNFFELGGDSLLAIQLASRIQQTLEIELTVGILFQCPTISELAEVLRDEGPEEPESTEDEARHLVLLRDGDSTRSLFCFHAVSGSTAPYLSILNGLNRGCRVFGLDAAPLLLRDDFSDISIETLAGRYMAEIRAVQPHGPYRLCGHSLGAAIALEIALHLKREAEEIAFLGALDWAPFPEMHRAPEAVEKDKWGMFLILAAGPSIKQMVWDDSHDFWKMTKHEKLLFAQEAAQLADPVSSLNRQYDFWEALYDAHYKYVARPYDGAVVYFRATGSPDRTDIWRKYVREVVYRCIEGGHNEIVESDRGAELGRMISEFI